MSSKARRVNNDAQVAPFDWSGTAIPPAIAEPLLAAGTPPSRPPLAPPLLAPPAPEPAAPPALDASQQARLASLEREAFAKGYEQGERAGVEAGGKRAEAMLRRLAQTLDELTEVRRAMIRQTERQMVQLALVIAKRVVRREVTIDRDLTLAMARVALDRLGDSTSVTIRLHPEDFQATVRRHDELQAGNHVRVVADGAVSRGGCLVESDFGYVDAGVDTQFQEIARSLLAEEGQELPGGTNGH